MASQKNFAITPSVSISRSKFRRPSQHKTSFNLGQIVPIYVDSDILPGDTVSMDLSSLVRMSTPIAPIMDNIFVDYYAFFVPNRIVWSKWKAFMGERTNAGIGGSLPAYPTCKVNGIGSGKLGDYLGLPVGLTGTDTEISRIPGASYILCYSEWFRDQNLIGAYTLNDNVGYQFALGYDDQGNTLTYNMDLLVAAKESDYFTRGLPYAQKGSPVSLPLGTSANILFESTGSGTLSTGSIYAPVFDGAEAVSGKVNMSSGILIGASGESDMSVNQIGVAGKLYADLSSATSATINQLRFAFQYQKFLEKDALYGTRYWEILKGHFGITAPDASLQRPELLGHFRQHINIDQVLQTSESGTTALGTPGANSVSGKSEHLISKSFVEHGTLLILAVARHEQTYGQGINRMFSRKVREDFYFPVFANLGAQEILEKEIYADGTGANDRAIFGYQEAWAEYRYKPSIVSGKLNPAVSGSLSFWDLANNFGSAPTLSRSFIEQDRTNLARALITGTTGPDFIADFYFDAVYVRPMPMYSIPGLIDHH